MAQDTETEVATQLTVRRMGGSLGATLSKDLVDHLQVKEGETLYAVKTENGILLTAFDPGFDLAMKAYQRGARKYRNALRELAK